MTIERAQQGSPSPGYKPFAERKGDFDANRELSRRIDEAAARLLTEGAPTVPIETPDDPFKKDKYVQRDGLHTHSHRADSSPDAELINPTVPAGFQPVGKHSTEYTPANLSTLYPLSVDGKTRYFKKETPDDNDRTIT